VPWVNVQPVVDRSVRGLCGLAYPGHPKGCPNLQKRKERCPPRAPFIEEILNLSQPVLAIYNVFDLGSYMDARQAKRIETGHPCWTDRQLRNCLYWQGTARAALRKEIRQCLKANPNLLVVDTPEATGVNVTATMAAANVELEWPPKRTAVQVVLAGIPKR
jgi:predicted metal-binding protein